MNIQDRRIKNRSLRKSTSEKIIKKQTNHHFTVEEAKKIEELKNEQEIEAEEFNKEYNAI